jgi:hypothetical protein
MQKPENKAKHVKPSQIILVVFLLFVISISGCAKASAVPDTTTNISSKIDYSTFEIQSHDIRFTYFKHPLYRFEYPSIFEIINNELVERDYNQTKVLFYVQEKILPKSRLRVVVQNPAQEDLQYHNMDEKLEFFKLNSRYANSFVSNNTTISGIPAYYTEAFFNVPKTSYEPEHQGSSRICFFDYAGLMWEISIDWHYQGDEQIEVKEYFSHVIETFKILE